MLTPIEAVESAYRTLTEITVLDPTCGSGAFLFAALDVLAECYEVLLDRAEELSDGAAPPPMLEKTAGHPNRAYFILKSAMLNNLYGVDIVPEACEIARLRMFLKLAAQLTEYQQIEPLPDLDFNIKTGNLLVGIAHQKDAEERIGLDLLGLGKLEAIEAANTEVAALMEEFSLAQQRTDDPVRILELKSDVEEGLTQLRRQLDRYLYEARAERMDFDRWVVSHQPFHWFAEFPGIFKNKVGFDVIIGNPPYIKRTRISAYKYRGYETKNLADIFTVCVERSLQLLESNSRYSMILPVAFQSRKNYKPVRDVVSQFLPQRWISTFDKDPDQLFHGVKVRPVILVGSSDYLGKTDLYTTRFNRWLKDYRKYLFENISYSHLPKEVERSERWLKIGSSQEGEILNRLLSTNYTIGSLTSNTRERYTLAFKTVAYHYLSSFIDPPPAYDLRGNSIEQPAVKRLLFSDSDSRDIAFVLSLSKVALLWWAATGDGLNLPCGALKSTPIPNQPEFLDLISRQAMTIQDALQETLGFVQNAGKWVGNYDVRKIRDLTDPVDQLVLRSIGLEDHWADLQLFIAAFMKSSGGKSALRELPNF